MTMFLAPWFAVAGLIAAAGPVLIHLFNRHRYRERPWGAMEFLRKAIARTPRVFRLRDPLLLALRVLCVVGFGLALAQPFLGSTTGQPTAQEPVHAVLLVDNSLSMSYHQLRGTVLDEAKAKVRELADRYPRGSVVSVVPLCGPALAAADCRSGEEVSETLAGIRAVDRAAVGPSAVELASQACHRIAQPAAKQIVLITDHQAAAWPGDSMRASLTLLPCPMKVLEVAAEDLENAWIEDFGLVEGVAQRGAKGTFWARVRYQGRTSRRGVQLTLALDGVPLDARTVDLEPDQAREIRFAPATFEGSSNSAGDSGLSMVMAEVSMPPDRLPGDDRRLLVVPVVPSLPVLMVDSLGKDEAPKQNRYGETYYLRRLLAASGRRGAETLNTIKLGELDREKLWNARVVVVAGVAEPASAVGLLREYVEQGGQLLIAAGGDFDPAAWTRGAWLEGRGVLPCPLEPSPAGRLPGQGAPPAAPFQLDFDSMAPEESLLGLEGVPREELADLVRLPYFFKAVVARVDEQSLAGFLRKPAEPSQPSESPSPSWLAWAGEMPPEEISLQEQAGRERPRVLASYTNRLPFLVSRRIGRGQVMLVTSSLSPGWNSLPLCNTMLLVDRLLRGMLERTMPDRNLSTDQTLVIPITESQRAARFCLVGSNGHREWLAVDALGGRRLGVTVTPRTDRGLYRLEATRSPESSRDGAQARLLDIPLAVNGPAEESQLLPKPVAPAGSEQPESWTVLASRLQVSSEESTLVWKWLAAAVLVGLLVELGVLGASSFLGGRPA